MSFKGKNATMKKVRILSFGTNMMGDSDGNEAGIHAEHNALTKLKPLQFKKNLEPINLLVIRLSKTNKIQSSKPCSNCIKIIDCIPEKKGYKIKNIYYSDNEGNIVKTTLNNLKNDLNFFYEMMRLLQ